MHSLAFEAVSGPPDTSALRQKILMWLRDSLEDNTAVIWREYLLFRWQYRMSWEQRSSGGSMMLDLVNCKRIFNLRSGMLFILWGKLSAIATASIKKGSFEFPIRAEASDRVVLLFGPKWLKKRHFLWSYWWPPCSKTVFVSTLTKSHY